jgi:hypothetical protein
MKKVVAIICTLSIIVSLAACGNQSKQTESSASSRTEISSGSSSQESSSASSTQSQQVTSSASGSTSSKTALDYRHKTEKYVYQQNNKDYSANYPQLSPEAPNYQKANDLLKSTAMQTIQSMGTTQTAAKMTAQVKSKLTNYDNRFISATFEETTSVSAPAKSSKAFRTVNFDLKKGTALKTADLIVQNDALNSVLLAEAKKQVDSKLKASVTAAVIKKGMQSCSVYFEKAKVGFSIKVPSTLDDHMEIELSFEDVKPFMSKSELWSDFNK